MQDDKRTLVVAVFPDHGKAEAAIDELTHAQFAEDQIGFLTHGRGWRPAATHIEKAEAHAANGAVLGAVTGATLGALAGIAASLALPGLGTVIAGGVIGTMIGGAAAGAALGSYAGPFVAMGFNPAEARTYGSDLQAGRTIVIVLPDDREEQVLRIMKSHGPLHAQITRGHLPTVVAHGAF